MISVNAVFSQEQDKELKTQYLSDTEVTIRKYRIDSQKYWDIKDRENALKYSDSIKAAITNSSIKEFEFITYENDVFKIANKTKPTFLQVSASWCAPCIAEIPALNKIAEKYSDKIDFVLLFWDTKSTVSNLASKYNSNIFLIPSESQHAETNYY